MEIAALYDIFLKYPSIQTDTRKLKKGDIYFALKGGHFNGNRFAQTALKLGAPFAIVDEKEFAINDKCILVNDVLETLQQLALFHRRKFTIPFIAITGSNGKTTTKELITVTLQQRYKTYATAGNLNNHIGVPLTILSIGNDAEMAVIEMGANHLGEIASYCEIALPTHGLITNCGKAHIEGFGSEDGVRKGKGELYDFLRKEQGTIFRNTDLDYLSKMANGIQQQITYGSSNALYIGKPVDSGMLLNVAVQSDQSETVIHSKLVGAYNLPNIMATVAIGSYFNISLEAIKRAVENYSPDNSRSQLLKAGTNEIILDAYNANPTSMRAAISNFAGLKNPFKILWIGAMKEMGSEEENEHRALVNFINQYSWQDVLLVGNEFKGLNGRWKWFENAIEAANFISGQVPEKAIVLIKGSRGSKMELLLEAFQ